MEGLFAEAVQLAGRLRTPSEDQLKILDLVDEASRELYLPEFEHYLAELGGALSAA